MQILFQHQQTNLRLAKFKLVQKLRESELLIQDSLNYLSRDPVHHLVYVPFSFYILINPPWMAIHSEISFVQKKPQFHRQSIDIQNRI